jgi:hypothetical protein
MDPIMILGIKIFTKLDSFQSCLILNLNTLNIIHVLLSCNNTSHVLLEVFSLTNLEYRLTPLKDPMEFIRLKRDYAKHSLIYNG